MANAWYRTGTISVTNGSATVTGSGTLFLGNINAGDIFFAPDGVQYEIVTVPDNVTLTLKQKDGTASYLGSTLSGQAYSIIKTGPNNATVATQLTTLATNWQQDRDQYAVWLGGTSTGGDGSGNYPLTDALGVSLNVACPAKLATVAASGLLTGFAASSGFPLATDTILQAIQKLTGGPGAGHNYAVGALTATGAVITTASTTNLKIAATGGTYRAYQTFATTVDKWDVGVNVNEANDAYQMRYEGGATAFAILPAGNVLIGTATASTGAKLEVAGSGSFTSLALGTGVTARKLELYGSGSGAGAAYGFGIQTDTLRYYVPSGVSNGVHRFGGLALADGTTFTEYANISSTGLAVTGSGSFTGALKYSIGSAPTLDTNGDFRIYAISNTSLQLAHRGTDGVTRVATITLT